MPATPIQPLITDAGLAAAIAAEGTGLTLQITHVQLGTGAYTLDFTEGSSDFARVALVAPVETNVIAGGYRANARFRVDVMFEGYGGATYGVSEIGFWAGDPNAGGVLFAIWAQPTVFAQRNMLRYLATFNLKLSRVPFDSVSVVIDPDLALALALVADHEAAENPHPQYVRHDAAQGLSAGQQLQARQNINAELAGVAAAVKEQLEADRVGTLALVLGNTPKPGTVAAEGVLLSRVTHARLWAHAQASGNMAASDAAWLSGDDARYSPGDGATTFRIPDLRAQHLRGADNGKGIAAGFSVGSKLADQLLQHAHPVSDGGHVHPFSATTGGQSAGHNHPFTTVGAGAHRHRLSMSDAAGGIKSPVDVLANGVPAAQGIAEAYYDTIAGTPSTPIIENAGDHSHTGTTDGGSVDHTHGVSGNTVSVGSGITVQNSSGGAEVRVKAAGVLVCIYY